MAQKALEAGVIQEVDRFIIRLLMAENVIESEKQVSFDAPSKEPATDKFVNCYLYDLHENPDRRDYVRRVEKGTSRKVASIDYPPLWFDLRYAISAGGKDHIERHELLNDALRALLRHPFIIPPILDKPLAGETSLRAVVGQQEDVTSYSAFWQAVNGTARPFLRYMVTAPVQPHETSETPLVRERVIRIYDEFFEHLLAEDIYRVSIAGFVRDENERPLQGATVAVTHLEPTAEDLMLPLRSASTDSSGFFYVTGLPKGEYHVQAHMFEYSPITNRVNVPDNNYAECSLVANRNETLVALRAPCSTSELSNENEGSSTKRKQK